MMSQPTDSSGREDPLLGAGPQTSQSSHQTGSRAPRIYDAPQLDMEEAETDNFAAIEESSTSRRQHPLLSAPPQSSAANKFRVAARRVITQQRVARGLSTRDQIKRKTHRNQPSMSLDLLGGQHQQHKRQGSSRDGILKNDAFGLYNEGLYPQIFSSESFNSEEDEESSERLQQGLPVTHQQQPQTVYGTTSSLGEPLMESATDTVNSCLDKISRLLFRLGCRCRPIRHFMWQVLLHCYFSVLAIPLAIMAAILYYAFGNPAPDFLPGEATLSWWCNFCARQIVTFEMGRLAQFVVVDCILLQNFKSIMGSFLTLLLLQARGWPCILIFWSTFDLFVLHGNDKFSVHWLYWTGWSVYSTDSANSGTYILESSEYLRFLICVMMVGIATTLKRAWLAIVFGRRLFSIFKPKLEMLLVNIVLLSEVAALGAYATTTEAQQLLASGQAAIDSKKKITGKAGVTGSDVKWSLVKGAESGDEASDSESGAVAGDSSPKPSHRGEFSLTRTLSGSFRIKQLLDRWDEPKRKEDLDQQVDIDDILRFRQALALMNETFPFGDDFGRASTRDECIESAHLLYRKLLKLSDSPDSGLSFSVFQPLFDESDIDSMKLKALRKLLRPGKGEKLNLLMFVQSIDSLYRRLRYFRASVSNAGSLDQTLEGIFNVFFYFILGLVLMSFMKFNPWSMLVSITSLLVSLSFAFGSTASKYVQGMLLIAVTRPFDLGDRIFLESPSAQHAGVDNASNGWLVEEISLSTTKLRYAKTNEVAYLANNLIADMRIYNANRSPNATVLLELVLGITALENGNLETFRKEMKLFVKEHPRTWDSLNFVRVDKIDADNEQVFCMLSFRHCNSWQDAPRIKLQREELVQHIYKVAKTLGVYFDSAPSRRILYFAGSLENGAVETYKTKLLRPSNIRSQSEGLLSPGGMFFPGSPPSSPAQLNLEQKKSI